MLLFSRLILRPLWGEPVRTLLTILAVALGVAVVIAIDLAGQAAAGSFHSSVETLTGKNDLLITGTGGVPDAVLGRLVQLPYDFDFSPRIEDFATLDGKGEAIPFIGLDVISHARNTDVTETARVGENPVFVGSDLHIAKGRQIRLLINDAFQTFTVEGIISNQTVILADIDLAQRVTGKMGRVDSIDVRVPKDGELEHWQEVVRSVLPASLSVEPQGTRTNENRKMLSAFRWNLRVLSYIALVVGGFLIYNTISISVVRRRNEIGVLRALGASRGMVMAGFLLEALFFAVVGTGIGLVLGRFMAVAAVKLIGTTVQALYVSSQPSEIAFTPAAVLMGTLLGISISLLAALSPAIEASLVAPVEAMARGRHEYDVKQLSKKSIYGAVGLIVVAGLLSLLPAVNNQPIFAYIAVLFLIAGTAAAIPNIVAGFSVISASLLQRVFGVEAQLAMQSLRAGIGRTSIIAAALTAAVAMTAAVGIMVGSFRQTVFVWMDQELKADFYLRPAGSAASDRHPTMSADIAEAIRRIPGVAEVGCLRAYPIEYEGMPATLAGADDEDLPAGNFASVSEPFASKHHVKVGSELKLALGGAIRTFRVKNVYSDYSTERGFILLNLKTLHAYLPDPAVSNVAVKLKADADHAAVRNGIDQVIGGRAVLVFANGDLRKGAIEIFDRTFRITYALEAVAIVIAVMGIAGSLLAMVIDRRREFALLRFLGAGQGQVRRIILFEAGILGLLANGIGIVMGTALSLILIFVINKQSFGWTIQFHWPALALLGALTGVYVATVIAGLYPAHTAIEMNPIEVIHEQ
jgi:putative ABC transport system permease protein